MNKEKNGFSRRSFLKRTTAATALLTVPAALQTAAQQRLDEKIAGTLEKRNITLTINNKQYTVQVDNRTSLLDLLREQLNLTGSKKGCDLGQCGACTVHIDGRRALSCLTFAVQASGKSITTIEGLANGDTLHPMQAAFIECDGFQCGYCTPGQIMSATAMLEELRAGWPSVVSDDLTAPALSDDEIRERMSGNLCRCATYMSIRRAIKEAAALG